MISSGSVPPSTPVPPPPHARARLPAAAAGALLVISAAVSGAFAGCSGGSRETDLLLSLAPDATCAAAPVTCVNELQVTLEDEQGQPKGSWTLPFDVTQGSESSLGNVPRSGRGRFTATGRASLPGISPVILFSGESELMSLSAKKDQRVVVPVACANVPDPCSATPTPTPDPFARFPTGAPADALVGQATYDQCNAEAVNTDDGSVREPDGLHLTSTHLWVADRNQGRIAVFSRNDIGQLPVPLNPNGFVIGHDTYGNGDNSDTSDDFDRPRGFALDPLADLLYVADTNNHRGQIYSPIPDDMSDPPADNAIGQDSPGDSNQNDDGLGPASLNAPWSVLLVPDGGMFVSDTANHRLLHFTRPIMGDKPDSSALCGQANATSNQANRGAGAPARNSMSSPSHLATDGTRLYLADTGNNRVLVWNTLASAALGNDPDFVLGQADFTSGLPNRGSAVAANTLSGPRGVAASSVRLVVADSDNHRVLIWQPPPSSDGEPATEVLGQASFDANTANHDPATAGDCPATNTCPALADARPRDVTLFRPGAALLDGDQLWISDTCNNRVLRYTAIAR